MKIDRFIFKSSHSFLTLRASWLVWCLYRYYRRNKSRCRFKRDVTIEYLTRTTLETIESFERGPHYHLFQRNVFILLTKMVYVSEICTDITPNNSRAKWEDYMKAWNYITIDFHQEMRKEYSKIVQVIVKADRGKAIAWRSVSWKMTCYHILDEKTL